MITCTGVQPRCMRCLVCDNVPFVRQAYARESTYWWAQDGVRHRIRQHEGGEQGDHHMLLSFSLAIHNALAGVAAQLFQGEYLFAYLDDIYVLAKPDRAFIRLTICWARGCSQVLGSNSTQGRPERGTAPQHHHQGWVSWGLTCGFVQACHCPLVCCERRKQGALRSPRPTDGAGSGSVLLRNVARMRNKLSTTVLTSRTNSRGKPSMTKIGWALTL